MESPPSYEAAIKQPNAFGGRIGVSLKYSMDFITFHANASQDGELSSQANLGVPISVRNLVRQVTVQLGGEDGGGDQTRVQENNLKDKIIITVVVILLTFLLVILIYFVTDTLIFVTLTGFLVGVSIVTCFCCCLLPL